MPLFWFLAGMLTTLVVLVVISPWLRTLPRLGTLPSAPWQASVAAAVILAAVLGGGAFLGSGHEGNKPAALAATMPTKGSDGAGTFGTAAKVFGDATGSSVTPAGSPGSAASPGADPKSGAGSMETAVAALEARLAKGGGSPDDWELLAKSFEFLSRPADAAKARAHQLPALNADAKAMPAPSAPPAQSGTALNGEVTLAATLAGKAAAGETLFIVAKSVDAPGIPVAVFRASVGSWPLKFTLDDSQSMMPGRNLSSAGRVTVEARISQKGQPLPAPGDLQGSSGVINPADHPTLKITIDRVIT